MTELLLTPTALVYLALLIQAVVVCSVLVSTHHQAAVKHRRLVLLLFVLLIPTSLALGLESASIYRLRLIALALQVPLLATVLLVLLLFSAAYPALIAPRRNEMRLVLIPATIYTVFEWLYAIARLISLTFDIVYYRPPFADYLLLALVLALPISLFRQARALQAANGPSAAAASARDVQLLVRLALLDIVVILAAVANLLRPAELFGAAVINAVIAQLILFSIFALVVIYTNAQAAKTSFFTRIIGLILTTVLGLFTALSWLPVAAFAPYQIPEPQSGSALLWQPNQDGGYRVTSTPYRAGAPHGTRHTITSRNTAHCPQVDFAFPFYGRTYPSLFVCTSGLITFDRPMTSFDLQLGNGSGRAAIITQLTEFIDGAEEGGVYIAQDRSAGTLTVRWYQLRPRYRQSRSDIELILARDGSFIMQFHQIGDDLAYRPMDTPEVGRWAIGALPAGTTPEALRFAATPVNGGPDGLLLDNWYEFRRTLHRQLLPYALAMIALSAVLVLLIPLQLRGPLLTPLNSLLSGVERMQRGDYSTRIPPGAADEIGFLISAFNQLSARLQARVATLEARVEQRSSALSAVHQDLRNTMEERLAAQAATLQQQRDRAALDERLRLSRDLHDSLGQSFASLAMLSSVTIELLQRSEHARAAATLAMISETAQQGHHEVRRVIGDSVEIPGLRFGLRRICRQSTTTTPTCRIVLEDDDSWDEQMIPRAWLPGLLQILQEALNNALRHAEAGQITVRTSWSPPRLCLAVIDDGRGFDVGAPVRSGHFGLLTMRERADEIGAVFTIETTPGNGCRISLCLTVP